MSLLFLAQEANAGYEGAAVEVAEGEEIGRADVVVNGAGIAAAGDVIAAAAQGEIVIAQGNSLFDVGTEREEARITNVVQRLQKLLLLVDDGKRIAGAPVDGVGEIELMDQRQAGQRGHAPGKEAVGTIPGIRAGALQSAIEIVNAVGEDSVG